MLVTNKQLIELLAEAAGITTDNVERQLQELTTEISQAISENEAYEIDGFGIFSGIGNRVMFIPSKELETEVNYKYVGMEPIEVDIPISAPPEEEPEDPFAGLIDDEVEEAATKPTSNPFIGLIDGLDEDEEIEQPGADKWGVEAHKEDDSAGRLFASLMGQDYETSTTNDVAETIEDDFDQFGDVFGSDDDSQNKSDDLSGEVSKLMGDETNIDAYNEESSFLDDLIEDAEPESHPVKPVASSIDDTPDSEIDNLDELMPDDDVLSLDDTETPFDFDDEDDTLELPKDESEESEVASESKLEIDEFDDPFAHLDAPEVDDEFAIDSVADEDIIPVIKNLSSERVAKVDEPEKEEKPDTKKKKDKKEKKEKTNNKVEQAPAPVWLWAVLLVVLSGILVYALGYFSIVNIPYITPQIASNTSPVQTPSSPPPTAVEQPAEEVPAQTQAEETVLPETTPVQEQPAEPTVTDRVEVPLPTGDNPETYGLKGELSADGNDGYTIILYSLSNQASANREMQNLSAQGFRSMIIPVASQRYGTLHRVCIGQFATLFDAAVAAEEIMDVLPENYLIKKIN